MCVHVDDKSSVLCVLTEKLNVCVVDPSSRSGLPSAEEERELEKVNSKFQQYIGIPRR